MDGGHENRDECVLRGTVSMRGAAGKTRRPGIDAYKMMNKTYRIWGACVLAHHSIL